MKFTGKLLPPQIDYLTGRTTLLFAPNEDFKQTYEELKDSEVLSLEIKKYRRSRSLNANNYFHLLLAKLADKLGTSKAYMKNTLISKYGQYSIENDKIVHLILRDDINVMEREEIHLQATSAVRILDDGQLYRVYRLMRGSHTYNSEEMAALINGTIADAKDIGIPDSEIATPDEKRILKEKYGVEL